MAVDRFVTVELQVRQEQPAVRNLPDLLANWGLTNAAQEQLWVIAYDPLEQIRTVAEVARGNYHEMSVSLPILLSVPLLAGVDRFQIVHNHPTGDTSPTYLDLALTTMVMEAANTVGLSFDDHLIVGPDAEPFSFVAGGLLIPNPAIAKAARGDHRRISRKESA